MIEQQPTTIVTREELVSKAKEFDASGYRLVQIAPGHLGSDEYNRCYAS